ncbi:MAG: hypothetical protein ACOC0P_00395 [Planctomycetota bacterium]
MIQPKATTKGTASRHPNSIVVLLASPRLRVSPRDALLLPDRDRRRFRPPLVWVRESLPRCLDFVAFFFSFELADRRPAFFAAAFAFPDVPESPAGDPPPERDLRLLRRLVPEDADGDEFPFAAAPMGGERLGTEAPPSPRLPLRRPLPAESDFLLLRRAIQPACLQCRQSDSRSSSGIL